MVLLDPLANALATLKNCEMIGKKVAYIRPISKLILQVLEVLKKHGYIKDYKVVSKLRGGIVEVHLQGKIHDIKAIKPRFPVKVKEIPLWEKKLLPSYRMGILILSTPKGVMDHHEAKKLHMGGRLIAYVY